MRELKFADGKFERQFANQRFMAQLFGVTVNAFTAWGLPHAYREVRDLLYDWGVTTAARCGQQTASERELKPSRVEELALG